MMRPDQLLVIVTARLEAIGIPYCVGGSFASSIYGQARNTYDLDILVWLLPEQVSELVAAFQGDFDIDPQEVLDAVAHAPGYRDTPVYRAIAKLHERRTSFRVDLFISSGRAFERSQLERRVRQLIAVSPEAEADFAAPEDIILAKLEWFQIGNYASTRQWPDVRAMLLVQEDVLDWDYLRRWADVLGVRTLLDRMVAGEPPPPPAGPAGDGQLRLF